MKHLLLISSSFVYGQGYLDHAEAEIRDLLSGVKRVLFVPYALYDRNSYAATARKRFEAMGFGLDSIHEAESPRKAVENAEAIFIGGGNTFRLLKALYDFDLLSVIKREVEGGIPYIGSSAGTVVACPTIQTTNDMPIVVPPSLKALGLVSFQINPHYLDPDPTSRHMGETREQRLMQFLEENDVPVVGLREEAMLRVEGNSIRLTGFAPGRIFRKGIQPTELAPGSILDL